MADVLLKSEEPLIFDTLPALKVCHFYGNKRYKKLYSYARLHLLEERLKLSLCAFERVPAPKSRIGFSLLSNTGEKQLFLSLGPEDIKTSVFDAETARGLALSEAEMLCREPTPLERFAGVDEQGWYWGASLAVNLALMLPGATFRDDGTARIAVFHYWAGDEAFGASHPVPASTGPLDASCFLEAKILFQPTL